jgi:hypothetical protein
MVKVEGEVEVLLTTSPHEVSSSHLSQQQGATEFTRSLPDSGH